MCGQPATDLHEIISPPMGASKYRPRDGDLAQWVYQRANCVLLCNKCNITIANSRRDELIQVVMSRYGPEEVVATLRGIASLLRAKDRVPVRIEFGGKTWTTTE